MLEKKSKWPSRSRGGPEHRAQCSSRKQIKEASGELFESTVEGRNK